MAVKRSCSLWELLFALAEYRLPDVVADNRQRRHADKEQTNDRRLSDPSSHPNRFGYPAICGLLILVGVDPGHDVRDTLLGRVLKTVRHENRLAQEVATVFCLSPLLGTGVAAVYVALNGAEFILGKVKVVIGIKTLPHPLTARNLPEMGLDRLQEMSQDSDSHLLVLANALNPFV